MTHSEWQQRLASAVELLRSGKLAEADEALSNLLAAVKNAQSQSVHQWHEEEVLALQVHVAVKRGIHSEVASRAEKVAELHLQRAKYHAHSAAIKLATAGTVLISDGGAEGIKGADLIRKALLYGGLSEQSSPIIRKAGQALEAFLNTSCSQRRGTDGEMF